MTGQLIIDQELVVHLYGVAKKPMAAATYQQVRQLWRACTDRLEITEPVEGFPGKELPKALEELPTRDVLAVRESATHDKQCALRRVHDVFNLSVYFGQPVPEGLDRPGRRSRTLIRPRMAPERRLGWKDFVQLWTQACSSHTDSLLGEARVYLARTLPGRPSPVGATPQLGQAIDSLLPYRLDRPVDWWRRGTSTPTGYAIWDTQLADDTSGLREIVLIAAADRDAELSAWVWSDGTADLPPFGRYLMHASKLRYEARLFEAWHRDSSAEEFDQVRAGLDLALAPQADRMSALRSRLVRLRAEQTSLTEEEADLAQLGRTVSITRGNLGAIPGSIIRSPAGWSSRSTTISAMSGPSSTGTSRSERWSRTSFTRFRAVAANRSRSTGRPRAQMLMR